MLENFAVLVPTVWVGILIGISFIATPAKFRAPSLARPVALEVGRVTFHFLSRLEWLLTALLVAAAAAAQGPVWRWPLSALVVAIVLLQSVWLLPALDRRVAEVLNGVTLTPSPMHRAYGALEGMKLLALLALVAAGFAR